MSWIDGKRLCDREVGSPSKGWHSCNRPARHTLGKHNHLGYWTLDACPRHVEAMLRDNGGYKLKEAK